MGGVLSVVSVSIDVKEFVPDWPRALRIPCNAALELHRSRMYGKSSGRKGL